MENKKIVFFLGLSVLAVLLSSTPAMATLDQAKLYQKAFGGEKPKCACCHVDKLPKKEDGKHEANEYGKKLMDASQKASKTAPDEDIYKAVGKNENAEA